METRVKELYNLLEVKLAGRLQEAPNDSLHLNVWDVIYNNEAELAELLTFGHSEDDVEINLKDVVIEAEQEFAHSAEYEAHYR